jgi:hypothetical protein
MVNTDECSHEALMRAIRRGNYYSSCGPAFHTIELNNDQVHLTTSPVQFVRLVGPGYQGRRTGSFDKPKGITETSLPVPREWDYVYIEIEDGTGKRAWTNTLYNMVDGFL